MNTCTIKRNGASSRAMTPKADILEMPEGLVLLLDLPGVKAEDVEVDFERGELTVKASRPAPARQGRAHVSEFGGAADYYRAFLISQEVAADKIAAELRHGVLAIQLPRAEQAKPRRVPVAE